MLQLFVLLVNLQLVLYSDIMFIIIMFLVVGGFMVYLAQDNLSLVTLHLGDYTLSDIPLFYVIVGSLLLGLGLAYLINLVNSIFVAFAMRGKDHKIKETKIEVVELTKMIHQLEIENERLKNNSTIIEPQDLDAL